MKLSLSLCAFVALGAGCASDTDDRPVTFSYIHAAILKPNCATSGCHSTLTQTAGVDLQDRQSALLIFQEERKVPIIELLLGTNGQKGRMPQDQPLPNADIELIRSWQDAGHLDN